MNNSIYNKLIDGEATLGVIGLGYVGLPLARLFATKYSVVGFDINLNRVADLKKGTDLTQEVDDSLLKEVLTNDSNPEVGLFITADSEFLQDCNYYIVTVPTSVDKNNQPVLKPLLSASKTIAKYLQKNDIVIYESTVYPGATEEDCIPILEKQSKLVFNKDFFVGYSPERISPGDKVRTVENILKELEFCWYIQPNKKVILPTFATIPYRPTVVPGTWYQ